MKWKTLAKYVSEFMKKVGIDWLVSSIAKWIGVAATGAWGWVIGLAVKFGWRKAEKKIHSEASHADRVKSDEQVLEEYQEKIKENASEEELIKSELDILNPRRD